MKGVLRDLLSPDKLRRSWSAEAPAPPPEPDAPADDAVALVVQLRALAIEQLPGGAGEGVHRMIDLLEGQVADRDGALREGRPFEGGEAIATLCWHIGDVVDALTIGGLRQGGDA